MSQEKLSQALELLADLHSQTSGEIQNQITQIRHLVEDAQKLGEGQDASAVRELFDQYIVEQSHFTSHMVHEVRKPMTSIRGYSDMLVKNVMGELNEMQSQFVGTIRNNIISMEHLITDISDLSKLKAGRIRPEPKMEMYKNIAMQIEKDTAELAQSRGVTLVFETPQGLPLLNLDSVRASQALRKLVDNAIKYTPEGTGQITVSAEGKENRLHIYVKDNGVGISAADQARLGELFFRGDQELVTQTKGYGMGIPIVMECAKLLGGELRWQSQTGIGSTFELILPAMS